MQKLASQWIQATVAIVVVGILVYNATGTASIMESLSRGYTRIIGGFYNNPTVANYTPPAAQARARRRR